MANDDEHGQDGTPVMSKPADNFDTGRVTPPTVGRAKPSTGRATEPGTGRVQNEERSGRVSEPTTGRVARDE